MALDADDVRTSVRFDRPLEDVVNELCRISGRLGLELDAARRHGRRMLRLAAATCVVNLVTLTSILILTGRI